MHRQHAPLGVVMSRGVFCGPVRAYDLKRLQEDIVLMYLIGKHKIDCSDERRKLFQFKTVLNESPG